MTMKTKPSRRGMRKCLRHVELVNCGSYCSSAYMFHPADVAWRPKLLCLQLGCNVTKVTTLLHFQHSRQIPIAVS